MPAAFPAIVELLPHAPPMVLLDGVVSAAEDTLVATVTIRDDLPFFRAGGVPSHVGLELMAQTIAVFAGLRAHRAGAPIKPGYLLGTRRYRADRLRFERGATLLIEVRRAYDDGEMANFDCRIRIDGETAAEARVNVYQPKDPADAAAG